MKPMVVTYTCMPFIYPVNVTLLNLRPLLRCLQNVAMLLLLCSAGHISSDNHKYHPVQVPVQKLGPPYNPLAVLTYRI